jgi:ubiquitin-protein ligase
MHESPRIRRLRNDLAALERLQSESSVFRFKAHGSPPHHYIIHMKGKSLWRARGQVHAHDSHRIEIKLGASYPRTIPEIRWITPIYHPNISEIGMVCLGGYGTHWVPSVQLDELCNMLWDMARYHNYDIRSPYNRDAALWVAGQTTFLFPTDPRPLRDIRAAKGRGESEPPAEGGSKPPPPKPKDPPNGSSDWLPPKNGPNGASGPPRSDPEGGESMPGRVRQFMNRYGGIFAKDPEPPVRRVPPRPTSEVEMVAGFSREALAPIASAPVVHQPVDDEIVLLESAIPTAASTATSTATPGDSARRADNGITFIE